MVSKGNRITPRRAADLMRVIEGLQPGQQLTVKRLRDTVVWQPVPPPVATAPLTADGHIRRSLPDVTIRHEHDERTQ